MHRIDTRKFLQGDNFSQFHQLPLLVKILSVNFFACVNEDIYHISKIHSMKCFCNIKVAELGKFFSRERICSQIDPIPFSNTIEQPTLNH